MNSKKFGIYIFNLIIAIICVLAIVSHFFSPLLSIKVNYTLRAEKLETLLGESAQDIDVNEIIDENGVPLKLTISIETMDLLNSLRSNNTRVYVEDIIDKNINKIVDELTPVINEIAKKVVEAEAKKSVNSVVHEQVASILGVDKDSPEVENALNDAGIDDQYLNEQTQAIIDAAYADGATVDTVADEMMKTVEDVYSKLEESGNPEFAGATLSDEDKAAIRDSISSALASFAEEDGSIDMNNLTAKFLLDLLSSKENTGDGEEEGNSINNISPISQKTIAPMETSTETDPETENKTEELKQKICDELHAKITDNTIAQMVRTLKISAGSLLFTMFTWAIVIVAMIIKLFCKNPAVHIGLPIWFGWSIYLVVLIGNFIFKSLSNLPNFIQEFLGPDVVAKITEIAKDLSIKFASSDSIAFFSAIALIILSIPYCIMRKSLKRKKRRGRDYYSDDYDD